MGLGGSHSTWHSRRAASFGASGSWIGNSAASASGPSRDIRSAVQALPPRRRLVIFLRYFADLSYSEIAEVMGIAEGTVAAALAQREGRLARRLEHRGGAAMTDVLATAELLSRGPDDGDWNEVRRRASRGRRRRQASVMFALVGAVAVVIASAYAFGHPIIDFGRAPKGPEKVVNDFGSLEVGAPAGMAPGVLPEEARRITAVPIDGKEHGSLGCAHQTGRLLRVLVVGVHRRLSRRRGHDKFAKHIEGSSAAPDVLAGSFFQATRLRGWSSSTETARADEIPSSG